ncbi:lantibiotic dehydratase [Streptomyces sp. NPDC006368]|uniref:lantibiotic dehydratase n=1 Tax=Streptomyces sp. NPDC006368 TaxID=3156760 RepID=UPI0033B88A80
MPYLENADAEAVAGPDAHTADRLAHSAPYALVRATVLAHPAQTPAAADFRALLRRLSELDGELGDLTRPLCDDLYTSRDGHPEAFHRDVVLPLRRTVHNGRAPRPALLGRLGDLPGRLPRLALWLTLRERRAALLTELDLAAPRALAAERTALAALCREPALARAVALTSADLLRAVERAGTGATDRRARKEEPNVLRYALRASTKTSPLSWFTAVGWGPLPQSPAPRPRVKSWGRQPLLDGPLHATVTVNRALTTALSAALLDRPHRRATRPHRITSTASVTEGRATYARGRTTFAGGRHLVTVEDEVEVAFGGPLRLLTERARTPAPLHELAHALASALPTGQGAKDAHRGESTRPTEGNLDAATDFVGRLAEAGLLVPTDPVPHQDADPLTRLSAWLRALGTAHAEDGAQADRIDELAALNARFATTPAHERPALLTALAHRWTELLADNGRPVPAGSAPLNLLSEDVVAPGPLRLDGFVGAADHEALGEVTALAELFDLGHLMRRFARDRFVERYGNGGRCAHPWEFGAEVAAAWEQAGRIAALRHEDSAAFPTGGAEIAALREGVADAVRETLAARTPAPGPDDDVVLPPGLVRSLGERLPRWAVERPVSYAYFLQRDPADGLLCVNHVYGGWGRFTSRFLDALDPRAAEGVARQIRRGLGYGAQGAGTDEDTEPFRHAEGNCRADDARHADGNRHTDEARHPDGNRHTDGDRHTGDDHTDKRRSAGGAPAPGRRAGARVAQIRPVNGFNANLHPLLVPEEIGPDRGSASIAEDELELFHDETTDQVRFRIRATGDVLDVLYPGFLAPIMLPRRIAPHLSDQPHGVVDFRSLVPRYTVRAPGGSVIRSPRLRHRHVVLLRRRWLLPSGVVRALRDELATADEVPAEAAARWRTLLALPEQIFLHPAATAPTGRATDDFLTHLSRPKPQFVDLGNALHLRCLAKWLSRHPDGVVLEEALPAPGGSAEPTRAVELVLETYRPRHSS